MRLFLSSYGFGNQPDKLLELLGTNKKVAIVTNAGDMHSEPEIQERVQSAIAELAVLGLQGEQFDLRDYFSSKPGLLKSKLSEYGLVWVPGGNTFVLRRAMAQSGFDEIITEMIKNDTLAYGGYSAGACVLSPSLKGIDLCDDPNEVPEGYKKDTIWYGLGIVNYAIVPHYKSDHPESILLDRTVTFLEHNNMPFKTLRDGEAIQIRGENSEFLV